MSLKPSSFCWSKVCWFCWIPNEMPRFCQWNFAERQQFKTYSWCEQEFTVSVLWMVSFISNHQFSLKTTFGCFDTTNPHRQPKHLKASLPLLTLLFLIICIWCLRWGEYEPKHSTYSSWWHMEIKGNWVGGEKGQQGTQGTRIDMWGKMMCWA